jgi:hypothetical protein
MGLYHHLAYVRLVSFTAGAHDITPRRRFDDSPRTQGEIFTTYDCAIGLNSGRDLTRLTEFLAEEYPHHRIIRITPPAHHWDQESKILSLDDFMQKDHGEAVAPAMLAAVKSVKSRSIHA